MFNETFKKGYFKNCTKYFETLVNSGKNFPQSIIFEGLDIWGQYFFTLELARILNCTGNKDENCTCMNCKWIYENKHPAIITVSQIDYKPESDESKTVISVKQIAEIERELMRGSDFHRFFIFLNADKKQQTKYQEKQKEKYKYLEFTPTQENWAPDFLNWKSFAGDIINKLLKSIEEPPERVTFVFLTKNREDLLQTIVSRSLIFKLSGDYFEFETDDVAEIFSKYPVFSYLDALKTAKKIENYNKDKNLLPIDFLNSLEQYLTKILIQNQKSDKILKDIENVKIAQAQIKSTVKPNHVFESLMLKFVQ